MVVDDEQDGIPRRIELGEEKIAQLDAKIENITGQKNSKTKEKKLKYLRWKRREIVKRYN